MDPAYDELERRSRYLSSLVRRTRLADPPQPEPEPETEPPKLKVEPKPAVDPKPAAEPSGGDRKGGGKAEVNEREVKFKGNANGEGMKVAVRVRAADMPLALQRRAIWIAREVVLATPRLESKRLALALKKVPPRVSSFSAFVFWSCSFNQILTTYYRSVVFSEPRTRVEHLLLALNDHGVDKDV